MSTPGVDLLTGLPVTLPQSESPVPINSTLPGLMSLETRHRIEEVLSCGLLPVIFFVGLVGNTMSIVVLLYQGTKEPTNALLVGLTLTDLLYIVSSFSFEMECLIRPFSLVLAIQMEVWTRYHLMLFAYIIGRISALFICLVAAERYIAVQFPFQANRWITRKSTLVSMLVTYLFTFAFCFCLLFIFDTEEVFHPELDTVVPKITYSQFALDNFNFLIMYTDIVLSLLFRFIPVGFVVFCTCSILRVLGKSAIQRNTMAGRNDLSKRDAEQQKINKMLLSICILFIVCTVPGMASQVARLLFSKYGFSDVGRYENIAAVVGSVVFLFSLTNSSINFVLYIATSGKFAATSRHLFLCGWKKNIDRNRSSKEPPLRTESTVFTLAERR